MKLALILGVAQGNNIKPKLQGVKDNLEIDCFGSIPEFIDNSIKRNSIYDRLLVLSNLADRRTINDLYNYWSATSKETEIVMLCKSGVDEDKATSFLQMFKTPVVAVMLLSSTTLQLIAEAVLRPTTEITASYGIKDFLSVEVDEDIYIEPEQPKPVVQQPQQTQQTSQNSKKKGGFLSNLFGNKSKKSQQSQNNSNSDNLDENITPNLNQPVMQPVEPVRPVSTNTDSYGDFSFDTEEPRQNIPRQQNQAIVQSSDNSENSDLNRDTSSSDVVDVDLSGFSMDDGFESFDVGDNDFEPEQVTDIDFGSTLTDYTQDEEVEEDVNLGDVTTVNDDLSGFDIAKDDESYRQTEQAPNVVTKVVVREVIRNVSSDLSTLDAVLTGKKKKTIVVTGDRGTGVTSTALVIARKLAEKISVLYVDCDIENHGLLNYIDYNNFSNYETSHLEGIRRCRSVSAFRNCVIHWDNNFDILTSDFSCECTLDDLEKAHNVVSEVYGEYGAVVVDCPVSCLQHVEESILIGETVLCVEGSKRGFMNMLTQMDKSPLDNKYKRRIADTGVMFVTKCTKDLDLPKLVDFISSFVELEDANYLKMNIAPFNGKLTDKLLNDIMEG